VNNFFIGRQPIYDADLQCVGYELFFRHSADAHCAVITDPVQSSARVLSDAVVDTGVCSITEGRLAFINVTRDLLLNGSEALPPNSDVVLEVPFETLADGEVLTVAKELKRRGYQIAVDNYRFQGDVAQLGGLVDVVKVDVSNCSWELVEQSSTGLRSAGGKLLADKVETHTAFDRCKGLGFDLLQGYFFCKPKIVAGRRLTPSSLACLQLLEKLTDPGVEVEDLEAIVEQDVSLSYKLLRFINSPYFGFRKEIVSVRQAIILAGLETVRSLAAMISLARIQDKPDELMILALTRAKMCESLSHAMGDDRKSSYFTVGLFSLLDAMLDRPMEEILGQLPMAPELDEAILEQTGHFGAALRTAMSFETGDWVGIKLLGIDPLKTQAAYLDSLDWAEGLRPTLREGG
jgi:EAL and modified HD-GYP domain-containing signal transduction protein